MLKIKRLDKIACIYYTICYKVQLEGYIAFYQTYQMRKNTKDTKKLYTKSQKHIALFAILLS